MKPALMIIFQTLATLGFGVNLILALIITRVPNGYKVVADLLEVQNPPLTLIVVMAVICFMGTILITSDNVQNMTWKERYLEDKKQIST